jgi:hypothetical protein
LALIRRAGDQVSTGARQKQRTQCIDIRGEVVTGKNPDQLEGKDLLKDWSSLR